MEGCTWNHRVVLVDVEGHQSLNYSEAVYRERFHQGSVVV
jgi:hypothetical protein